MVKYWDLEGVGVSSALIGLSLSLVISSDKFIGMGLIIIGTLLLIITFRQHLQRRSKIKDVN